jgi:DNA-binding NtrC family response regulator
VAERIIAVLVQDQNEVFGPLRLHLHQQRIPACVARSCADLLPLLAQHGCQQVVSSDTSLTDGIWADVLVVSSRSCDLTPVTMVSRLVDVRLYMDALERGAFDFIVPPFNAAGLEHIVRSVISRRHHPTVKSAAA